MQCQDKPMLWPRNFTIPLINVHCFKNNGTFFFINLQLDKYWLQKSQKRTLRYISTTIRCFTRCFFRQLWPSWVDRFPWVEKYDVLEFLLSRCILNIFLSVNESFAQHLVLEHIQTQGWVRSKCREWVFFSSKELCIAYNLDEELEDCPAADPSKDRHPVSVIISAS